MVNIQPRDHRSIAQAIGCSAVFDSKSGIIALHEANPSKPARKDVEEMLDELRQVVMDLNRGQITREEREKVREVVSVMLR